MERATGEPVTSLAKLKCNICNGYLSVYPINKANGKYVCGNCNPIYNAEQKTIYEEVMKVAKFSCVYETCNSLLTWNRVKDHEENCPHRTIVCPHFNCEKKFKIASIEEHFTSRSSHFVTTNPISITRKVKNNTLVKKFRQDRKLSLLIYKEKPYLVFVLGTCTPERYEEDFISSYNYIFGVFAMDNQQKNTLKCRVSMKLLHKNSCKLRSAWDIPVRPFNENLHCFNCFQGTCQIKYHVKMEKWQLVNFENIVKIPNLTIEYEIGIYERQPSSPLSKEALVDLKLSDELECPICREYMYAPIYNCAKGHAMCEICKNLLSFCLICKADIGNSRNFALENIAARLKAAHDNAKEECFH